MVTHSSILAWRIPWTGRLQFMGSKRVGHDWVTSLSFLLWGMASAAWSVWGYLNGDPLGSNIGINSKVWTKVGGGKKAVHPSKKNYRASCLRSFKQCLRRSQDGGGIGPGDHFLSYKFIERIIERWTNFTKQLLIASRGHQAPRKATHCLRREVGQNIKDKKGDKRARDRDPSQERSLNRGSFQSPGNPHTVGS